MPKNQLEGLLKHRFLDIIPRNPDSVGLGQGLRICISSKLSGAAAALRLKLLCGTSLRGK